MDDFLERRKRHKELRKTRYRTRVEREMLTEKTMKSIKNAMASGKLKFLSNRKMYYERLSDEDKNERGD